MITPISQIIEAVEKNLQFIKNDSKKIHPDLLKILIDQNEAFLNVLKSAKIDERNIIIDTFENGSQYGYQMGIFQKVNNVVMDESSFISGSEYYEQNFTNDNEKERAIKANKQSNQGLS